METPSNQNLENLKRKLIKGINKRSSTAAR